MGIEFAPACAIEEHFEPLELSGQGVAVVVPRLATLGVDCQVFIGRTVAYNPHLQESCLGFVILRGE